MTFGLKPFGATTFGETGVDQVFATGVASVEAFGSPRLNANVKPLAIATAEAFGIPTMQGHIDVGAGVPSAEAFGAIKLNGAVHPAGGLTAEAFGAPKVNGSIHVRPVEVVRDSGTAQAGSADTLTLAAGAPTALPADSVLRLPSGPGSVQERPVSAYDGGTKVATVSPRWRTNRALRSEEFDNASWSLRGGGSLTANAAVAPDGTLTAEKLFPDSAYLAQAFSFVNGTTYTISYYVKAVAANSSFNFGTLTTGDLGANVASGTATSVWQRFSHTFTPSAGTGDNQIYIQNLGTADGIYVWGAQLEVVSALGDYIKTVAAAITLPDATTGYEVVTASAEAFGAISLIGYIHVGGIASAEAIGGIERLVDWGAVPHGGAVLVEFEDRTVLVVMDRNPGVVTEPERVVRVAAESRRVVVPAD